MGISIWSQFRLAALELVDQALMLIWLMYFIPYRMKACGTINKSNLSISPLSSGGWSGEQHLYHFLVEAWVLLSPMLSLSQGGASTEGDKMQEEGSVPMLQLTYMMVKQLNILPGAPIKMRDPEKMRFSPQNVQNNRNASRSRLFYGPLAWHT